MPRSAWLLVASGEPSLAPSVVFGPLAANDREDLVAPPLCGGCVGGTLTARGRIRALPLTSMQKPNGRFSQVGAGRLPADPGGRFDASERPPQAPQRDDLLLLLIVQDIATG